MLDRSVLAQVSPLHRDRRRFPKFTVLTEIGPELHDALLEAVRLFDSNKSRVLAASLQVGLPIVLQQAKAAAHQQQG